MISICTKCFGNYNRKTLMEQGPNISQQQKSSKIKKVVHKLIKQNEKLLQLHK